MIQAQITQAGYVLQMERRPGSVAYVDSDWLRAAAPGPVPALVAAEDGLRWHGVLAAELGEGMAPERAAARCLAGIALDIAAIVTERCPQSVNVIGNGAVAWAVRKLLDCASQPPAAPEAVVDTTGDPNRLIDATRRLAPLGLLILAGEACGRELRLNVYANVHRRGLEIVGVSPLSPQSLRTPRDARESELTEGLCAELMDAVPGVVVAGDALWYRVEGKRKR